MIGAPTRPVSRWRAFLVTFLAVGFVARMTLVSAPVELEGPRASFICLLGCRDQSVRDLLSNILLFLPLGWMLRHWLRPRYAVGVCLLVTMAIELAQATVITGRDPSLRDILSNVAGGALGVWLFDNWRRLRWPETGRSTRLGGWAALAWIGMLAITSVGTRLAPTSRPWFGQWTAELAYYDRYPGTLLSVDLDGWSPPNDLLTEPVPLRGAMRRDSFLLRLQVVSGPAANRATPIFSVYDDSEREQLFVGQFGRVLWLHLRNRFESWEFRGLTVRLRNFPGWTPGDTVSVEAGLHNHEVVLRARSGNEQAEVRVPQTVGLGWTSMLPSRFPMAEEWLLVNPVWLAGLMLPVGYWFGRAAPWRGLGLTALTLSIGLALVPLVADTAWTTRPEWMGAAAGAVLGWAWGTWSRRRSAWVTPRES
jgi:hypothetical protein